MEKLFIYKFSKYKQPQIPVCFGTHQRLLIASIQPQKRKKKSPQLLEKFFTSTNKIGSLKKMQAHCREQRQWHRCCLHCCWCLICKTKEHTTQTSNIESQLVDVYKLQVELFTTKVLDVVKIWIFYNDRCVCVRVCAVLFDLVNCSM